jgi:hypothetical protein
MDSIYTPQAIEPDDEWVDDSALEEMFASLKRESPDGCLLCEIDEMDDE